MQAKFNKKQTNRAQALSAAILFIRCTSIDPSDRTRYRFRRKKSYNNTRGGGVGRGRGRNSTTRTVKYGLFTLRQLLARVFKRMERKILKTCIRRKYHLLLLDSQPPLLPFPLVVKEDDDASPVAPHPKDCDISFCSLCDFEVDRFVSSQKTTSCLYNSNFNLIILCASSMLPLGKSILHFLVLLTE